MFNSFKYKLYEIEKIRLLDFKTITYLFSKHNFYGL